jgi:hypothetical protein
MVLHARALESEMLPEEAERGVVSASGAFACLGPFSYNQECSSTYMVRCDKCQ